MRIIGIIPAYAGSTSCTRGAGCSSADHPRIRGEHVFAYPTSIQDGGSSPHTRGAPEEGSSCRGRTRIIPAYAGSTRSTGAGRLAGADHPRIRGEHLMGAVHAQAKSGSSPHTRGAPARSCPHGASGTDHPRIRGEHRCLRGQADGQAGSSPHTRGARPTWGPGPGCQSDHPRIRGEHHRRPMGRHQIRRIIPAYAGSTRPPRLVQAAA